MAARLSQALAEREPLVGNWMAIGHPSVAEILALLEFDFVVIDSEHTSHSLETTEEMIRAVESVGGPTQPLVRVADNDPIILKRILDCGPAGVLVPMVETENEARALVDSTQYPPDGFRGIAASRATGHGLNIDRYLKEDTENLVRIVQLETAKALDNASDIAAVDGIDGVFIGPMDLSISLDLFKQWDNSEFTEKVDQAIEDAHSADTSVGTLAATADQAEDRMEWEIDFIVAGVDKAELITQAKKSKQAFERRMQRKTSKPER